MYLNGFEITLIDDTIAFQGVKVYVYRRDRDEIEVVEFGKETTLKKYKHGECFDRPSFTLPRNLLKRLAEAIQNMGVQLDSQSKTEGVLEAQTKHLEDMRKLVFDKTET